MRIIESFEVPAGIDVVWTLFAEPKRAIAYVPGASLEGPLEDGSYRGEIAVSFGPRVVRLRGAMTYDRDDVDRRGSLTGSGADKRGNARASFRTEFALAGIDEGTTRVDVTAEITFAGALAEVGQTGGPHVVRALLRRFAETVTRDLAGGARADAAGPETPAASISGARLLGSAVAAWVRGDRNADG